jgi:hypothetical protein
MSNKKFQARLQAIARASGFAIKQPSLPYVAGKVRAELDDDANAGAILSVMRQVRLSKPDQFTTAEQMLEFANGEALQRLETANRQSAEEREAAKRAAEAAKPKVTLTPRELALPPEVRLSLMHEREAAAAAAMKADKR